MWAALVARVNQFRASSGTKAGARSGCVASTPSSTTAMTTLAAVERGQTERNSNPDERNGAPEAPREGSRCHCSRKYGSLGAGPHALWGMALNRRREGVAASMRGSAAREAAIRSASEGDARERTTVRSSRVRETEAPRSARIPGSESGWRVRSRRRLPMSSGRPEVRSITRRRCGAEAGSADGRYVCGEGSRSSQCNGEAARPMRSVAAIPKVTSDARRGRFTGLRLAGSGPDAPLERERGAGGLRLNS